MPGLAPRSSSPSRGRATARTEPFARPEICLPFTERLSRRSHRSEVQMSLPLKIVVADDEQDTREYLQEYLAHLGHDVRAAEDGRRLVAVCQEFCPDLIVTDYAMPGMDGLAA